MPANRLNALGQAIGYDLTGWKPALPPLDTPIEGRFCRIERIDPDRHAIDLFEANASDQDGQNWTYLPYGPFADPSAYQAWLTKTCMGNDPFFHAIIDRKTGKAVGVASYLRIDQAIGVIEVGHINYSPLLQRRPAGTEAMYLLMRRAFDELGYRRYEWKCDALNSPSRSAAVRLGFQYEGTFRQATMYKGRNRDTAWYAITDNDWSGVRSVFEVWLSDRNFGADGSQRESLSDLMGRLRG